MNPSPPTPSRCPPAVSAPSDASRPPANPRLVSTIKLALALAFALVLLPFLPWFLLAARHPLDPGWNWDPILIGARRALWLGLPATALLATLDRPWSVKLAAFLLCLLALIPSTMAGHFAQTCAIGRPLVEREADAHSRRIQVVECRVFIFRSYRVQQARSLPPFDRVVATYLIEDDDPGPIDLRFESRSDPRWVVLSGRRQPRQRDPQPPRHDLILFEVDPRGRLRHQPIEADLESSLAWPVLANHSRRHEQIQAILHSKAQLPATGTGGAGP